MVAVCAGCGDSFPSRNAMFRHLRGGAGTAAGCGAAAEHNPKVTSRCLVLYGYDGAQYHGSQYNGEKGAHATPAPVKLCHVSHTHPASPRSLGLDVLRGSRR